MHCKTISTSIIIIKLLSSDEGIMSYALTMKYLCIIQIKIR